jgi:hypothetical protein
MNLVFNDEQEPAGKPAATRRYRIVRKNARRGSVLGEKDRLLRAILTFCMKLSVVYRWDLYAVALAFPYSGSPGSPWTWGESKDMDSGLNSLHKRFLDPQAI